MIRNLLFIISFTLAFSKATGQVNESNLTTKISNYIFVNRDRARIHDTIFLSTKQLVGAQIKYIWKELEPKKDSFNFQIIKDDVEFLKSKGKSLFIQLQDVSFDSTMINVPDYLLQDTVYHCGVNAQYVFKDKEENFYYKEGWVSRRWDVNVASRFHKLMCELGKMFDGIIAGINLPETSVEFGTTGKHYPKGFTCDNYKNAIKENMLTLKTAFPNTIVIQYINYMPCEFLPWTNGNLLKDLFAYAQQIKVGVGNPDLMPYKKSQINNSYQFIKSCSGIVPIGVAVQDGNYQYVNPKTGVQVTVDEMFSFAKNELQLNYIFWCLQEPYFSNQVIPYLRNMKPNWQ